MENAILTSSIFDFGAIIGMVSHIIFIFPCVILFNNLLLVRSYQSTLYSPNDKVYGVIFVFIFF